SASGPTAQLMFWPPPQKKLHKLSQARTTSSMSRALSSGNATGKIHSFLSTVFPFLSESIPVTGSTTINYGLMKTATLRGSNSGCVMSARFVSGVSANHLPSALINCQPHAS
ncbi:MAG: hypothetical protein ACP5I8_14080, partial [Phycisphaerae bacterium]